MSFEFAALDYTLPRRNRYAYRMEGFSDQWVELGSKRDVTFTNLEPRAYRFQVKASNADGVWNEASNASLRVIVRPPFWRTWWFRGLSVAGLALALLGVDRLRVRRLTTDLAEQRRAEEALRAAEEKYRSIFENAVEGIFQTTPSGRFLAANPAMARILGYRSAEELGADTDAIVQLYTEAEGRSDFKRVMEERGSVQGFTTRVRRKDGTTIWVSASARAVRDASGAVVYFEGTAEDITERKRVDEAEEALRTALAEAAMEWERTFDAMEAPTLIVDALGRIARLNHAARELAGSSAPRELAGHRLSEIGSAQPWEKAGEMAAHVGRLRSAVHCQVRDDASAKTWDLTAGPAAGPGGGHDRVIVVARDITRMVELQDSLRRSETMSALGELVSGVAHEVRNPLFGISANLDAFEASMGKGARIDPLVNVMRSEVNRLTVLMQDLLDYGKPVQSAPAMGAIDTVVGDAVESCARLATNRDVQVVNQVPPGLPHLPMDRKRLVQVFQNLLQNAVQHSPKGSVVSIEATQEARADGAWVVVAVMD
ncbi:MAG: PAS domain S-box protein, partial [bacterium]